jgi:hypothetical protein
LPLTFLLLERKNAMTDIEVKPDLTAQWKERLARCAALKEQEFQAEPTAEIELEGFKFIGRRLPLKEWIRAGRLPAGLLRQMLAGQEPETGAEAAELSPDEIVGSIHFQRDAVMFAVAEPRIVAHEHPAEDEISYADLCTNSPELVNAILQWIFAGCPGVPVAMKEGSVSVDALHQFRQQQSRGTSVRASVDESEVRDAAQPSAGDQG